jgi:hypothetical protein
MRRQITLVLMSVLLVLTIGCDDNATKLDNRITNPVDPAEKVDPPVPTAAEFVASLGASDWEVFSGSVYPEVGGYLRVQPTTWPRGSEFAVFVPSDALPVNGDPVTYTMRIPKRSAYEANPGFKEIVMDLSPSTSFQETITLGCTFMPWLTPNPGTIWEFDSISPVEDGTAPTLTMVKGLYRFTFGVDHFSLWGVGEDD